MIDLSSNESAFPPSELVIKAAALGLNQANRYLGHEELLMLRKSIAKYCGVREERIIVGPGTNWINGEIAYRLGNGRDAIVLNPSFSNFLSNTRRNFKKIRRIQLIGPEFAIDWKDSLKESSLIFIDSPNNPIGQCLIDKEQLLELLENKNHLLVIDEAGFEYSGKTFVDLVESHQNLAITRTFDKAFALAGFRISYLIAGDEFLEKLSPSDSLVSRPGCLAALEALKEIAYMQNNVNKTIEQREFLKEALVGLNFEVYDSFSNYLLVKTNIQELGLKLLNSGILIEDLSKTWLVGFYRITVGEKQENLALLKAIKSHIRTDSQK